MSKIRVRIEVEASGVGIEASAEKYPVHFGWDVEYQSTGDNPRFYGSQLQAAVRAAARRAAENLAPFVELGGNSFE